MSKDQDVLNQRLFPHDSMNWKMQSGVFAQLTSMTKIMSSTSAGNEG
jgi:hypothetical protein